MLAAILATVFAAWFGGFAEVAHLAIPLQLLVDEVGGRLGRLLVRWGRFFLASHA
jgi:hypothetical protein